MMLAQMPVAHGALAPYVVERVELPGDGIRLMGLEYRAPGPLGDAPIAVVLHGWLPRGSVGAGVVAGLALRYQQAGYRAIALSLRGWEETGGEDDCGVRQARDLVTASRALRQEAAALVLVGHSQGGQVALLAAALGAPVSAIVAYAAPTDLTSWAEGSDVPGIVDYVASVCSEGDGTAARSPLAVSQRIRAPVLLVHGTEDSRVPPGQSVRMHAELKGLNRDVWLRLVPGATHALSQIESLPEVLGRLKEVLGR